MPADTHNEAIRNINPLANGAACRHTSGHAELSHVWRNHVRTWRFYESSVSHTGLGLRRSNLGTGRGSSRTLAHQNTSRIQNQAKYRRSSGSEHLRRFGGSFVALLAVAAILVRQARVMPNPSIERTRSGSAGLAQNEMKAKRGMPLLAAHVKR